MNQCKSKRGWTSGNQKDKWTGEESAEGREQETQGRCEEGETLELLYLFSCLLPVVLPVCCFFLKYLMYQGMFPRQLQPSFRPFYGIYAPDCPHLICKIVTGMLKEWLSQLYLFLCFADYCHIGKYGCLSKKTGGRNTVIRRQERNVSKLGGPNHRRSSVVSSFLCMFSYQRLFFLFFWGGGGGG